jgi:hypothetical protein
MNVVSGGFRLSAWGIIAVALALALASQPAKAQVVFASVVGNVTDASGAAVPGATVKLTEVLTNVSRTVQSNDSGSFTVSTVPAGTYQVEITKEGFRGFVTSNVTVTQNVVVRVDAQLQIGAVAESVQVTAEAAALQTDRADVHAEVSTTALQQLPQPNRTYIGLLTMVPGMTPPGGQLNGGTNNPSKSMQFSANGTGVAGATVRIEGMNANNPWVTQYQSFVPSVEAIENVNVVTNSPDAEQGQAGGASVNVMLKSGANEMHGGIYWYHINSATTARNFFAPAGTKVAHLIDNNAGGFLGGRIIKDKLFYFGSYEGDFLHQANAAVIGVPTPDMLAGNMAGAAAGSIFDPNTGLADGSGRTPFLNNAIPQNRLNPIIGKLSALVPRPNLPGVVNNYFVNQATVYNLHKVDTKVDYQASSKLRFSGRYGKQPYYNKQDPLFGEILGGNSGGWPSLSFSGAGNYLQHGATTAFSGAVTYVASPTFIIDGSWGITRAYQLLFPTITDQRYGSDVLGIPGTNVGPLPWSGGLPAFGIANYGASGVGSITYGYSYPALEYNQPVFEYVANATKIHGSHSIRFGTDITRIHANHIEVSPSGFFFSGGVTTVRGGAGPTPYNAVGDFIMGLAQAEQNFVQVVQPHETLRVRQYSLYVRDQWQVNRKLTVNYGVRWEYYPVPREESRGIFYYDTPTNVLSVCGLGSVPDNCGINVSKKLFAPSIGIAYRPSDKTVIRAGAAISPFQINISRSGMKSYPDVVAAVFNGPNAFQPAGSVSQGIPVIPDPVFTDGKITPPPGTGNLYTTPKDINRGYIESWNFTVQRELKGGFTGSIGYVGTHVLKMNAPYNINFGQLNGGTASQPFFSKGITGSVQVLLPTGSAHYHSMQVMLNRRLAAGLSVQTSYTWSHEIGQCCSETGSPQIPIPEYQSLNRATMPLDVTHNFHLATVYELPFGKGKPFVKSGPMAWVVGGWSTQAVLGHVSGLTFNVTSAAGPLNAPNVTTQRADLVKSSVAGVGDGLGGNAYFDPLAFRAVTDARFGTAGFDILRGPGNTNLDLSLFRSFTVTERVKLQFRAEAFNLSNTPHFGNPGSNVSNLQLNGDGSVRNLNGFSQITTQVPLGRIIDPRYFRFGLRVAF